MNRRKPDPSKLRLIAQSHGLALIDLSEVTIPSSVVELVPAWVARENQILPFDEKDGVLTVIIGDPQDYDTLDRLRFRLNRDVEVALSTPEDIETAIDRYYGRA